jgi:hypothetical protein
MSSLLRDMARATDYCKDGREQKFPRGVQQIFFKVGFEADARDQITRKISNNLREKRVAVDVGVKGIAGNRDAA